MHRPNASHLLQQTRHSCCFLCLPHVQRARNLTQLVPLQWVEAISISEPSATSPTLLRIRWPGWPGWPGWGTPTFCINQMHPTWEGLTSEETWWKSTKSKGALFAFKASLKDIDKRNIWVVPKCGIRFPRLKSDHFGVPILRLFPGFFSQPV